MHARSVIKRRRSVHDSLTLNMCAFRIWWPSSMVCCRFSLFSCLENQKARSVWPFLQKHKHEIHQATNRTCHKNTNNLRFHKKIVYIFSGLYTWFCDTLVLILYCQRLWINAAIINYNFKRFWVVFLYWNTIIFLWINCIIIFSVLTQFSVSFSNFCSFCHFFNRYKKLFFLDFSLFNIGYFSSSN